MATKDRQVKLSQVRAKHTRDRHRAILEKAVSRWYTRREAPWLTEEGVITEWADRLYALAHAIAFAGVPGRQTNRNAAKILNDAVLATARKVRGWS